MAQAEALDAMLAGLGRGISSVLVFDLALEQLVSRLSGRRVCRAAEHVYHVDTAPPKVEGICDIDGSDLYQRDDDHEDVIRARYQKQWVEAAGAVLDYYESRDLVVFLDAAAPRDEVARSVDEVLGRILGSAA
jgi:adenylate kinase